MPSSKPSYEPDAQARVRLSPTEAQVLEAFLNPEATILAVAQSLKLGIQELLDALTSPAIRAAFDTLAHLDAIRRRLALAPVVPGALAALRGLLDQKDKPAEVRRAATTLLNTYTRLDRLHSRSPRASALGSAVADFDSLLDLLPAAASPVRGVAEAAPRVAVPTSPFRGVERRSRQVGAPSPSAFSTGSTEQAASARTQTPASTAATYAPPGRANGSAPAHAQPRAQTASDLAGLCGGSQGGGAPMDSASGSSAVQSNSMRAGRTGRAGRTDHSNTSRSPRHSNPLAESSASTLINVSPLAPIDFAPPSIFDRKTSTLLAEAAGHAFRAGPAP